MLIPVPQAADILGITPRRVNQYKQAQLIKVADGQTDLTWLMYLRVGEKRHDGKQATVGNACRLVASSWLAGLEDPAHPKPADLNNFAKLCQRNGHSRDAAMTAIGQALRG